MYTSFYNLKKKPFQLSADPEFIWLGKQHKEALDILKQGVLDNEGFLLITGDVGTGKTTLINTLIQSLTDDVIFAPVPDPSLSRIDFFNYIAASFGIDKEFATKGTFIAHFQKFLLDAHNRKKKVLLIIDESQLLTHELLEELRLLGNIEKANKKLINIFFVGQNELIQILRQKENRAVRQRLTLNYNIDPLTPYETDKYITHRFKIAGAHQTIFQASAVQEIFMYSGGFPRRINVICDHALLTGYVREKQIIDADIIHECTKDLDINIYEKNRDTNLIEAPSLVNPAAKAKTNVIVSGADQKEEKRFWVKKVLLGITGLVLLFIFIWWGISSTGFPFGKLFYRNLDMNGVQERNTIYSISKAQTRLNKSNQKMVDRETVLKSSDSVLSNPILEQNSPAEFSNQRVQSDMPSGIRIEEIISCSSVSDKQYSRPKSKFSLAQDATPKVWMKVISENPSFTLTHVYYFNKRKYCEVPLAIRYHQMRTWSSVTLRSPDHIGKWRVEVIDDSGAKLDQIEFVVVK